MDSPDLRSGRGIEPVTRATDFVVSAEPIGVREAVGTAFGHNVNNRPIIATILGMKLLVITRNSWAFSGLEFIAPPPISRNRRIVVINAIQQEIVVAIARPVDFDPAHRLCFARLRARAGPVRKDYE